MPQIRVRVKRQKQILVHNDLSNAGYYFYKRIGERIKNDDREGVGLEMMACLMMIAFSIEAKANFLGWKLSPKKWDEGKPTKEKLKLVAKQLGVKIDFGKRPYLTVTSLKTFRDEIAHGKPIERSTDDEEVIERDKLDRYDPLTADWDKFLTTDFLDQAYGDVNAIWLGLLGAANLNVYETLTQGSSSFELIEHIPAAKPKTVAI
ncbi:hypothetical protein [Pararhizobium sp.]|uniref:hypothetical protein n=1 Tax=Pararhizobium sp. TaxID=1977563 RepID=UPI003D125768